MAKITFDTLTFSRASTNFLGPYGTSIEDTLGPFSSNTPCEVTDTFDGAERTGIQFEGSRTNSRAASQTIGSGTGWNYSGGTLYQNNANDPLENATAERFDLSTGLDYHEIYSDELSTSSAVYWSISVFSKYYSNMYSLLYCYGDGFSDPHVTVDLTDGSVNDYANVATYGSEDSGDGWYFQYMTALCNAYSTFTYLWAPDAAGGGYQDYYNNAVTGGAYAWQTQAEVGGFPSSIIVTTTSAASRPADNGYWAEGDVDSNLRGTITVYVIPGFSSAQLYDVNTKNTILHFNDATQDYQIYFERGSSADTGRIIVYGASAVLTTGDHTWSRGQLLKLVINPSSGEIITTLFTTGNGTHSGSGWSTDDGNVYVGQKSDNTEHFFGVIFEPEYGGAEPPAAAPNNAMIYSRPF